MGRFFLHSFFCGMLWVANTAMAESPWNDTLVIGGVDLGHKSHKLGQLLDTRLNFYMVGGNIQFAYQDYYLGLNVSHSIGKTNISEDGETGTAKRSDLDLILGWHAMKGVTLFAGYKQGKTELDFLTREIEDSDDDLQTPFSSSFKETGPYLGVAYTHRFSQSGQLTFSLAYALLKAKNHLETGNNSAVEDEEDTSTDPLDFDDLQGDFNNDSKGVSFAMKWAVPISKDVYYTSLFRINNYQQKISGELDGTNRIFDVDETFIDINVGFIYVF